jgi:hypothetical protein
MPVADYFSPDYRTARDCFCAAANDAGARVTRHVLPDHLGPQGESLSTSLQRYIAEHGMRAFQQAVTGGQYTRPDHWAHARARHDALRLAEAQRLMRAAFYCDTLAWKAAVYGRTADFVLRTCRALAQPA